VPSEGGVVKDCVRRFRWSTSASSWQNPAFRPASTKTGNCKTSRKQTGATPALPLREWPDVQELLWEGMRDSKQKNEAEEETKQKKTQKSRHNTEDTWAAKNSAASMRIGVGGIDGFCSDVGFGRRGATVWSRRMESWQW
jgi:hypothetical protein